MASRSKAGGLQTSLRGCEKSQDGAQLITASANLEAKMQVPEEMPAGATVALQSGQNKHLSEFMRLGDYWKTMESSIWPSAQTAKGLKTQPKLASSDSSRPRMRNVLSPTRCALGLASFHHASWGFLQIKRVFPQRKRQVAHPCASRRSCTSLCSLLHHQTHVLGGGEGAVRVFLVSPIGTAQTRLPACKEHCREKRASRRTACQRLSLGPPLRGWLRHTLKKGPLAGSSIT